jgi:benzoyl-CoA reductase/2-hydroxyglutaryl-CoA dehydratase subunit BcrC/BadD/HgdB
VVNDQTCFGGKVKYRGIDENGSDPLGAIAGYQIMDRPFCPKIGGAHALRTRVLLDAARDFKVDGIVGQRLGCCDSWGGEFYLLRQELKEAGIPSLMIEREYIPDSRGQLSTRVQAFIETLGR